MVSVAVANWRLKAPGGSTFWYHRQESNLYLALRRRSFYPLNYGGGIANCKRDGCAVVL